jgi:hypothetical protein
MWRRIALLTAVVVLMGAGRVWAQLYSPQTIEQDFRVEWQVGQNRKGPMIDGYVYNKAMRAAEHMRLKIDRLDSNGQVVGSSTAVVLGTVPMDGRAYFTASVPPAASYRVQPYTFDWTGGGAVGSGGGGM